MQWNFTGEQVIKGEADYSLEEFRKDLYAEVKENFPEFSAEQLDSMFRLAYDVCYCIATRRDLGDLLKHCRKKGIQADKKYLELIRNSNLANIDMLKALFARKVSVSMDAGLSGEEALKKLDEYHKQVVTDSDF
jgi:hypothetical protein